jgi:hypothetical protein
VRSTPEGAVLFVDGREVGTTPQVLQLSSGTHQLRFERSDFQPLEITGVVRFGQNDTISTPLVLRPATLSVRSTPLGAQILIDGNALTDTITPGRITRPPGTYVVGLELYGYDAYESEIELVPGGSHKLAPALAQQFGYLKVARPSFGTLVIDGVRGIERSLRSRSLSVGRHELQLEGYDDIFEVEITKDDTTSVRWE